VLYCGLGVEIDKGNVLTYRVDVGMKVKIPFLAYLIRTDKGNILFDSGIDHDDLPYMTSIGKEVEIKEEDSLLNRLREANIAPEEIDFVFQSHLHWDHSGMLRFFPNAEIIVQREEYGYAINPPPFAETFYRCPYYNSPNLNWQIIDGDESVVPGITTIFTPGHTTGHQSLIVNLPESGVIILAGDCAYISENIEREIIPGIFVNPVQALHSLKRLKSLAQITNGQIFFSHSSGQLETIKGSPKLYK